jgi:sugar phosphate isomerase/epimerase
MGRRLRIQGGTGSKLGWPAHRSGKSRQLEDIAKTLPDKPVRTELRSRSSQPICKASSWPFIPAYDTAFDGFAAPEVRGNPAARQAWAVDQVKQALTASRNLGITAHATFSGALAWPYIYPWPQRPAGLVETAFDELPSAGGPFSTMRTRMGVNVCYEIHPGEDLHDGVTFEMFLERVDGHGRAKMLYDPSHYVLQCLDYLDNIDIYKERIGMFHVKDAEFNPTGRQGVYGGYQPWVDRAGPVPLAGRRAGRFRRVFPRWQPV